MIGLALRAHYNELIEMYDQVRCQRRSFNYKNDEQLSKIFLNNAQSASDNYRKVCYCIAIYAKVPPHYLGKKKSGEYIDSNIKIKRERRNGYLSIFFNRLGKDPYGEKHGHIVINKFGKIIYYRPIGADHGIQNCINHPWLMPVPKHLKSPLLVS